MSWDKTYFKEEAICACGRGKVVRNACLADDDWNRQEYSFSNEIIKCDDCAKKYHIQHKTESVWKPVWEGGGSIDRVYLVPINETIELQTSKEIIPFSLEEEIVANFSLNDINKAKNEMLNNKYSTTLKEECSKKIFNIYYKCKKRKGLANIIDLLNKLEKTYYEFEWTHEKYKKFRNKEITLIENNKKIVKRVLNNSFELDFKRI